MSEAVFVSHASQDKEIVEQLLQELAELDVDTWVSFRDIAPGSEWNRAIHDALDAAAHVIIVVSQNSINSDYVLAEVEFALGQGKTVIPVLIEDIKKLPVRWHTLQYLRLPPDGRLSPHARETLDGMLPKKSVALLRHYLTSHQDLATLRKLIWSNSRWFGTQYQVSIEGNISSRSLWQLGIGSSLLDDRAISCLVQLITEKSKNVFVTYGLPYSSMPHSIQFLVYVLASPFESPFKNGQPSKKLTAIVEQLSLLENKIIKLLTSMGDYEPEVVGVKIFAGQRYDQDQDFYRARTLFEQGWDCRLGVKVASYTRLLEAVESGSDAGFFSSY